MTSRPPEIDLWDAARARMSAAGLWRVYDEVCGEERVVRRLAGRGVRPGLRPAPGSASPSPGATTRSSATPTATSASAGSRGPTGSRRHCPRRWPTTWVGGHFELADLAVLESHRRHGGGRRLHDVLMDGETRPALLATDDADTAAVRLFTSRGWQRLGLLSEGVQVMGLRPAVPGHDAGRRDAVRTAGGRSAPPALSGCCRSGASVGVAGFEPAAFRSQSGRATKLRHTPSPRGAVR